MDIVKPGAVTLLTANDPTDHATYILNAIIEAYHSGRPLNFYYAHTPNGLDAAELFYSKTWEQQLAQSCGKVMGTDISGFLAEYPSLNWYGQLPHDTLTGDVIVINFDGIPPLHLKRAAEYTASEHDVAVIICCTKEVIPKLEKRWNGVVIDLIKPGEFRGVSNKRSK